MKTYIRPLMIASLAILLMRCSDDAEPKKNLPKLSINDAAGQEGESALFTVTLSEASTETVSFGYVTTHGTTAEDDFETVGTKTTISIAPGQTTAQITINLNTDDQDESAETFKVVLSDPANAELSDDIEGTGTINNVLLFFMKVKIGTQQWIATQAGFFYPEFFDNSFAGYGSGTFFDSQLAFVFYQTPTGPKTYAIEELSASDDDHVAVFYAPTFFSDGMLGPVYNAQPGGEVVLTKYDAVNGVAEGTFHFQAKNENNETLQFTQGQFRIIINN
jgi:hypothetical protein